MIKLLLVSPPLSAYSSPASLVPSIGLVRLGTSAETLARVELLDMAIDQASGRDSWSSLHQLIKDFQPDIVGIGPLLSANVRKGENVAKFVKSILTNVVVIAGGPDPSAVTEERLLDCRYIDGIIRGEAEIAILAFLKLWNQRDSWHEIPGFCYRAEQNVILTPVTRLEPEEFEQLPLPNWSLLPIDSYKEAARRNGITPYLPVEMSRGCPYSCCFCVSHMLYGHKLRTRSVQKVIDEIDSAVKIFGYRRFTFNDDNAGVNIEHLISIGERIIQCLQEKIQFSVALRPDSKIFDQPNVLTELRKAGLSEIFLGCESEDTMVIAELDKTVNPKRWKWNIERAVDMCRRHEIACRTNWMIGIPKQTKEIFFRTIEFIKMLSPDTSLLSMLQPYPGTKFYDYITNKYESDGVCVLTKNPAEFVAGRIESSVETKWLTKEDIVDLVYQFLNTVGPRTTVDVSGSPYYLFEKWHTGASYNGKV